MYQRTAESGRPNAHQHDQQPRLRLIRLIKTPTSLRPRLQTLLGQGWVGVNHDSKLWLYRPGSSRKI